MDIQRTITPDTDTLELSLDHNQRIDRKVAARIEKSPLSPDQLPEITDIIRSEKANLDKIDAEVAMAANPTSASSAPAAPDNLHQAQSHEISRSKYESFIDEAKLPESDALKLKEMMSEANYMIAVDTAKELKASKIPTYEQIARELMTLSPERLRDICEMMEKPELVIESDQGFADNVGAMDDNKHYTAADGQSQENTYVNGEPDSPYRNLNRPGKVKVSIVDGVVHPKQLTGVSTKLGARRSHITEKFAAKKMKHIGPNAMAALLQQSLKRAKAAGDNNLIVDNWEKWVTENIPGTATFIEPDELTESALVAYSLLLSFSRRAGFVADPPRAGLENARGRASVQVLEI